MLKHIGNPKSSKPAYEYFQEQPDRRKNEVLRSDLQDVKAQYFKKSYQNELDKAKRLLKKDGNDATSEYETKFFLSK